MGDTARTEEGAHMEESVLSGWYVGYAIGAAVIVIVVVLLAGILATARRIGVMVDSLIEALVAIRTETAALPAVGELNATMGAVATRMVTARQVLVGE